MAKKKYTVELNDAQQAGLEHVTDVANEQIERDNEEIRRRNDNRAKDAEPEQEKELHTPETYLQFVIDRATESYARDAASKTAVDLTEKLKDMPAEKRKQVEALLKD